MAPRAALAATLCVLQLSRGALAFCDASCRARINAVAAAHSDRLWSYDKFDVKLGPKAWCELPGYAACAGAQQSPIDLCGASLLSTTWFESMSWGSKPCTALLNNGRSIQCDRDFTEELVTRAPKAVGRSAEETTTWVLAQVHVHWQGFGVAPDWTASGEVFPHPWNEDNCGSEHTVNGVCYPGEVHAVHYNKKYGSMQKAMAAGATGSTDGMLVVGWFLKGTDDVTYAATTPDDSGAELKKITDALAGYRKGVPLIGATAGCAPNCKLYSHEGAPLSYRMLVPPARLDLLKLAPKPTRGNSAERAFYRARMGYWTYAGSLTTPGCSQAVTWIVLQQPAEMLKTSLAVLRNTPYAGGAGSRLIASNGNTRPVQCKNGRDVLSNVIDSNANACQKFAKKGECDFGGVCVAKAAAAPPPGPMASAGSALPGWAWFLIGGVLFGTVIKVLLLKELISFTPPGGAKGDRRVHNQFEDEDEGGAMEMEGARGDGDGDRDRDREECGRGRDERGSGGRQRGREERDDRDDRDNEDEGNSF